MLRKTIM